MIDLPCITDQNLTENFKFKTVSLDMEIMIDPQQYCQPVISVWICNIFKIQPGHGKMVDSPLIFGNQKVAEKFKF